MGEGSAVIHFGDKRLMFNSTILVEGIHFDLSYMTARELGHKVAAVSLSSVAAAGCDPRFLSVSVGLRQDQGDIFVGEFFGGAIRLARRLGIEVVGENTIPSPSFCIVSALAIAESRKSYFSAGGARPGDLLMVTGSVGASAAGLALLKRLGRADAQRVESVLKAHVTPMPRVQEALALVGVRQVTALVDVRDGLARDLHRLVEQSGVGALVEQDRVPTGEGVAKAAALISSDPAAWALFGGEDFELLFSVRPKGVGTVEQVLRAMRVPVSVIGQVKSSAFGVKLKNSAGDVVPLLPKLWTHFARRSRARM